MNEDQQRALESVLLANWGKQPSEIINALYLNGFAIVPVDFKWLSPRPDDRYVVNQSVALGRAR